MAKTNRETEPRPIAETPTSSLQRRAEAHPVPELVDATAALDIVRRYVEAERRRSRRIVVWTSTVAFFVVVFVLTAFISIGIFVLSRTRQTADRVEAVETRAESYIRTVSVATNRILQLEDLNKDIAREFREGERDRFKSTESLKMNLQRFGRWVRRTGRTQEEAMRALLEERLARIETKASDREEQLESLRKDYGYLQEEYASLQAAMTARDAERQSRDVAPAPLPRTGGESLGLDNLLVALDQTISPIEGLSWPGPLIAAPAASGPPEESPPPRSILEDEPVEAPGQVSSVEFPNGDRFQGQIKYGLLHGWGIYTYQNGDRYEGNFTYDMREGEGTLVLANGDKYVGEFRDDAMSGKGTMIFQDGSRYTGEFSNGRKHGKGVLRFTNGDTYTGDFKSDARTGFGTYGFANGDRYTGEFLDGLRHGQGRYTYSSGGEYVGRFKDGKKQGEGVSIYPNGKQAKGLWEDDEFVRPLSM